MCGINGIFAFHDAAHPVDRGELMRSRDYMSPRGRDGAGAWVSRDGRAALAHRRLAIIDLFDTGAQPMLSTNGRFVVTFNGEIYNFRALRRRLEEKGRQFSSQSDTEVLLHLYAERGEAMVHELRGMYAFAIWDELRQALFLARDPYGIKPLYYADDTKTFRFASQVKALVAGGGISPELDPAGQVGFYLWGSIPEPFTTISAVRAVPAGTSIIVDRSGARAPTRYHSIANVYCEAEARYTPSRRIDKRDCFLKVRDALADSVSHHLVADVPVGAFLSSGVDSGTLVGLMREAGAQNIQTLTLAFDEFRGREEDESALAELVARTYGTQHTTRLITQGEFETDLPRILDAMDQPSIDGINTWFAAKTAKELGLKVAISGLGGDELFGGYPSFRDIPRWVKAFALPARIPGLGYLTRRVLGTLGPYLGLNPKAAGMFEFGGNYAGAYLLRRGLFMPWELTNVLRHEVVEAGMKALAPLSLVTAQLTPCPSRAQARVSTLESALYMRNQLLRDTDWASMAHSVEIRVPLVDSVLLRSVAEASEAASEPLGRDVLANCVQSPLPSAVRTRPKTGFTTPIDHWMISSLPRLSDSQKLHSFGSPRTAHWSRRWAEFLLPG